MHPNPSPALLLEELERLSPALRRRLRALLEDPTRVDDVLQDVRLRVLSETPTRVENPTGWLSVVARNLAHRVGREEARRRRRERAVARPDRAADRPPVLEHRELLDRVARALARLPVPERIAVIDRYLEGLDAEAIALRRGVSRATVDRRLARARRLLRSLLEDAPRSRRGLLVFLPFAWRRSSEATSSIGAGGGVLMGAKTVVIVVGAFVVGHASGWIVHGAVEGGARDETTQAASSVTAREPPRLTGAAPAAVEPSPDQVIVDAPADPDRAAVGEADTPSADAWLARINGAASDADAAQIVREIVKLGPEPSRDVLVQVAAQIRPPSRMMVCLKPCLLPSDWLHPYAVDILQALARSPEPRVQNLAFRYAENLAWEPMNGDLDVLRAWCARHAGAPVGAAVAAVAQGWARQVERSEPAQQGEMLQKRRPSHLRRIESVTGRLGRALADVGFFDLTSRLWHDPTVDPLDRAYAMEWTAYVSEGLEGDEATRVEAEIDDILRHPASQPEALVDFAARLVGQRGGEEALDLLLEAFERVPRVDDWSGLALAVSNIGKPRAIPVLIAVIETHGGQASVYGVGSNGLRKLTGVAYDASHDGAWWHRWWQDNRERFPEARNLEIPVLRPVAR